MKKQLTFIFFFTCILYFCQITVPYRTGNKYGISDESGKIIIPANYDIIDVLMYPGEFTATKQLSGNVFKTTYIVKNKPVLQDTDYNYFGMDSGFIIATRIKDLQQYYMSNGSPSYSSTDVYSLSGQKVFEQSFRYVNFIEDEKKPLTNEILVLANDQKAKNSLYLLNTKTLKVSKTFFEGADEVKTHYEKFPAVFSIDYYETDLSGKRLILNFENGKLAKQTTENIQSLDPYSSQSRSSSGSYDVMPTYDMEGIKQPPVKIADHVIAEMKDISNSKKYTQPYNIPVLSVNSKKLLTEYFALIKENGKIGYMDTRKKQWIIPAEYDEIMTSHSTCGNCDVFVVKKGGIYKILETGPDNKLTPFKGDYPMIPVLVKRNYGKDGFHLVELYDKDGNLFCYANQDGVMYYK
ncbi:WG repeat-containing protein [Chryseobacterium defluvii]|uniref:WG repeat protein n=1 Tax=Chryseobacterium defluvii TaxID=160396 RepID=A0A495SKT0_9FLAO|nr:WG repeat-containing protein [Chryseobacterium defluvii]RKT00808.1 WG repeat protein [Chryseobacterium defluvii]